MSIAPSSWPPPDFTLNTQTQANGYGGREAGCRSTIMGVSAHRTQSFLGDYSMSETLRILFVYREFYKYEEGDGMASYMVSLGQGLAERGHEVHILCCERNQETRDYARWGLQVHLRDQARIPGLRRVLGGPRTARRLETSLAEYREWPKLDTSFDVVECPDWGADGLVYAFHHPLPLVAHLHSPLTILGELWGEPDNFDHRLGCELERWSVDHADVVTAPSEFMIREVTKRGWLRGVDHTVIPNPIDLPMWLDVRSASDTEPVVLFVGRLEALKAPDTLLEALRYLQGDLPKVRAILVGRSVRYSRGDSYSDQLRRRAEAIGGCEFIDVVPRRDLPGLMERARVIVVPSRFEAFSMVALEGMASGRPVIVSDATGIADLVRDKGVGSVVPCGDSQALAEALRPFLQDPQHATEIGIRARSTAREYFSPERVAMQKEAVYRKAIAMHSAA